MQDLRIAMVQMNSRVAANERNLATIARFTEQAAAQNVDIVCFPELCVCGYNTTGNPSNAEAEPLRSDSLHRLEEIVGAMPPHNHSNATLGHAARAARCTWTPASPRRATGEPASDGRIGTRRVPARHPLRELCV